MAAQQTQQRLGYESSDAEVRCWLVSLSSPRVVAATGISARRLRNVAMLFESLYFQCSTGESSHAQQATIQTKLAARGVVVEVRTIRNWLRDAELIGVLKTQDLRYTNRYVFDIQRVRHLVTQPNPATPAADVKQGQLDESPAPDSTLDSSPSRPESFSARPESFSARPESLSGLYYPLSNSALATHPQAPEENARGEGRSNRIRKRGEDQASSGLVRQVAALGVRTAQSVVRDAIDRGVSTDEIAAHLAAFAELLAKHPPIGSARYFADSSAVIYSRLKGLTPGVDVRANWPPPTQAYEYARRFRDRQSPAATPAPARPTPPIAPAAPQLAVFTPAASDDWDSATDDERAAAVAMLPTLLAGFYRKNPSSQLVRPELLKALVAWRASHG